MPGSFVHAFRLCEAEEEEEELRTELLTEEEDFFISHQVFKKDLLRPT